MPLVNAAARIKPFALPPFAAGTALASFLNGETYFWNRVVALNGILSSALTALQTTAATLNTVSDNISNVNTAGYVRRKAELSTIDLSGNVAGVKVSDITRTVSAYLDQEAFAALGTSSQYGTQSDIYDQINALLGNVGDGTSLSSQLSNITSALATASQSIGVGSSTLSVVSALQDFAGKVSSLYTSLSTLRNSVDSQVSSSVDNANTLIKKVSDLNAQIAVQTAQGNDSSALCDQRDVALQSLAKLVGIRTASQDDGTVTVTTSDGTLLVGSTYARLSYTGGNSSSGYGTIGISYVNPLTGKTVGDTDDLDTHISSGTLKGLIEMRDGSIGELQTELGELAKTAATAYNAASNAYTSYPPPNSLTGRQTGLLGTEALNISGTTTIALADSSGKQVGSSYTLDFTGMSADDIVSALNSNLGVTASYSDGKLSIKANDSGYGIVIDSSANTGSTDFSTFFGLNDLFQTSIPTASATGLSATSLSGVTDDVSDPTANVIKLAVKNAAGKTVASASVSVSATDTVQDVLNKLNNALKVNGNNTYTFTMNADGSIGTAAAPGYADCSLVVTSDTTERGDTGVGLTQLFGIGDNTVASYAANFSVSSSLDDTTLPTAKAKAGNSGSQIVQRGDTSGVLALENVQTATRTIAAAGGLSARSASVGDYANLFYQDIATRSSTASDNCTTESDRLAEAKSLQSSDEGVNLDEELSNMLVYQKAYNAAAKLLTTYGDLLDTLLNIGQL